MRKETSKKFLSGILLIIRRKYRTYKARHFKSILLIFRNSPPWEGVGGGAKRLFDTDYLRQ
jgi:hypothetical protein